MIVDPEAIRTLAAARAKDVAQATDPEQMLAALGRYLEVQPGNAVAWADKAGLLTALRRDDEAQEACRKALAINPLQLSAMFHLGTLHANSRRLDEAESLFRRILAMDPGQMEARLALARCLMIRQDPEAAREVLAVALKQEPASLKIHQLLDRSFYQQAKWEEFRIEVERFRSLDPGSDYLEYECGFVNLLHGVMPLGWRQWEARLRIPGCVGPERDFQEPRWNGETFAGRTLLVHYEQGLGDTLMLVRFLPQVKALGGTVILLVQPKLTDLVRTCRGADQVIPQGGQLPPFDLQVSLYSLPAVLKVDLDSLPADIPYLDVPSEAPNRRQIDERMSASEGRLRIGLAWAGNPKHPRDSERSLPPSLFGYFQVLPEVAWYGFQFGDHVEPSLEGYVSLAPILGDFSDTAYALSFMDLVITVDTALAHLAGALGVPTFLLVTHAPDFRWMLDRDDSPWYPTLRIYRQPRPGDWESVIREILDDLGASS